MSGKNIYQKINQVMQAVKYVQKDKEITGGGQSYKAVTHDQVIAVARDQLVKNGIVIYPSQLKGKFLSMRDLNATPVPVKMSLYSGLYEISFINIDNPDDRLTLTIEAHANDNGDKAPGKALTYATKAALLKVLSLETGENDESRGDQLEEKEEADREYINQWIKSFNECSDMESLANTWKNCFNAVCNDKKKLKVLTEQKNNRKKELGASNDSGQ